MPLNKPHDNEIDTMFPKKSINSFENYESWIIQKKGDNAPFITSLKNQVGESIFIAIQ